MANAAARPIAILYIKYIKNASRSFKVSITKALYPNKTHKKIIK